MKPITFLFALIWIVAAACSPTAETAPQQIETIDTTDNEAQTVDEPTVEAPTDAPASDEDMSDPTPMPTNPEPAMDDTDSTTAYNGPAWTNLELINARTGETFTLADFAGKTVFIEPMATWCTNCRAQQRTINEVIDQLDPNEFVMMSLSVETFLSPEELETYATNYGFDWTFAVASDELLDALVNEFGRSVSSPPSVPHFTISANGVTGNFSTGSKSGEAFLSLVRSVADGS